MVFPRLHIAVWRISCFSKLYCHQESIDWEFSLSGWIRLLLQLHPTVLYMDFARRTLSPCSKWLVICWLDGISSLDVCLKGVWGVKSGFCSSCKSSWDLWMTLLSLILRQNINSFGLGLLCLLVFLQAANADGKSDGLVLRSKYFAAFTAASACPFDRGLYGEEVSWVIPFVWQYVLKGPRNWGPPSVLQISGMPKILMILSSTSVTDFVLWLISSSTQMYPLYLSAVTMYVFPLTWQRSIEICSMGNFAVVCNKGSKGLLGRSCWQGSHPSIICLMSYFMEGQKYRDLAVCSVLP